MGVTEDLADQLAQDVIKAIEVTGEEDLVYEVARELGATSQTARRGVPDLAPRPPREPEGPRAGGRPVACLQGRRRHFFPGMIASQTISGIRGAAPLSWVPLSRGSRVISTCRRQGVNPLRR